MLPAGMFKDIVIGAGDLGFDFRACQIGHSVATVRDRHRNDVFSEFKVVLPSRSIAELGPATCALWRIQ